jgi:hypothetical protein
MEEKVAEGDIMGTEGSPSTGSGCPFSQQSCRVTLWAMPVLAPT